MVSFSSTHIDASCRLVDTLDYRLDAPIIRHYSTGQLARPKDKLVALYGVARRFASKLEYIYLADLEEDLVKQLFWKTELYPEPPVNVYSAPSWSWASIDSSIE